MAMLAGMQEILINFDEKALDKMRKEFEDLGLSLDFSQFVTIMRKMLPELNARDKVKFVADIRELFDEIDINGDGDLEWGEFTAYCANLGFVATKHRPMHTETRKYILDDLPLDSRWFKGPCVEQVLYIEEFKMLVVVESLATSLKFFDTRFRPTHSFQPPPRLRSIRGRKGKEVDMHIGAPSIKHVCYVPALEAICMTTSDQWLSFYHASELNLIISLQSPVPVSFCCWSNDEEMLLTVAGDDNHLECWNVKTKQQVPVDRCTQKSEVGITGIVEVRPHKIMITAGHRLSLWNLTMDKVNHRGHLKRTRRQVERLVYSEAHDLLLTTSTDRDCVGWDLATRAPMLYLKGHRYSLADVRLAPFGTHQHAITVDRHGVVKMWNIARTVSGFATCLQSIDTRSSATSLAVLTPKCDLVVGADKLRVLRCVTEQVELNPPTCAIYNPLFATVLVAMGDSVRIYDANTGRQSDFFPNICKTDISDVCLDDRKRKFCVATNDGDVLVCSYQDGVPLKRIANPAHKHKREIVTVLYNDEDKCLLTTAWDRRLCVWDEDPREEVELLRMTHNAHQSDILCMTHSRRLSLIATGSVDKMVNVFDFQFCKQLAMLEGHTADVTCMSFVDPFALLVSGDATGTLIFWQMRPLRWAKIAVLRNDQGWVPPPLLGAGGASPGLKKGPPMLHTAVRRRHSVRRAKAGTTGLVVLALLPCPHKPDVHLYTGDEKGVMRCWNISVLLSELTVPAEKRLLTSKTSYNPSRRLEQTGDECGDVVHVGRLYKVIKSIPELRVAVSANMKGDSVSVSTRARRRKLGNPLSKPRLSVAAAIGNPLSKPRPGGAAAIATAARNLLPKRDLGPRLPEAVHGRPATALETHRFSLLHKWKAHNDTIKSLQVVEDPAVLVTSSVDMSVCFWTPEGERAGLIDLKSTLNKRKNRDWHFDVDWHHMIEQKRESARKFLAEEKLRKQKRRRELEWQRKLEARGSQTSGPQVPVPLKMSATVQPAVRKHTPLRRRQSDGEGPAQILLRKGRQVTATAKKKPSFLASLGPRTMKPGSAQRRRAEIRTSILSQLIKTARWQSENSIEEQVSKQSPPAPPDPRPRRYTMPSLDELKSKYNL